MAQANPKSLSDRLKSATKAEKQVEIEVIDKLLDAYIPGIYLGNKKQVKGFFIGQLMQGKIDDITEDAVLGYCDSAFEKSKKAKESGDRLEADVAKLIGGQIGKGQGSKDLEWRVLAGGTDVIKEVIADKKVDGVVGLDTFMFYYADVCRVYKGTALEADLVTIKTTPVDAYSVESGILAIAGGGAKFKKGTNELSEHSKGRINELIDICQAYNFKPLIAFNRETVTDDMMEQVVDEFEGKCQIERL
jgi:hypothetical protein